MHSACLQLKNRPPPPPPLQRSIGPSVRIPIGSVRPIIRDVCNDGCIWNNGSAELTLGMIVVSDLRSGACLPGPATVGTMLAALAPAPIHPSVPLPHTISFSPHESSHGSSLPPSPPHPNSLSCSKVFRVGFWFLNGMFIPECFSLFISDFGFHFLGTVGNAGCFVF